MEDTFEPTIVCFCCQWCSYAAADLAGSMRLQYPANVKILKIPCTGRIDVIYLLRAIEEGADGVFVSGCLLGDCHYMAGNYRATKRVAFVKRMLETIGMDPQRVEMFYNSSAMGPQFAQCCRDFTDRIRKLGPGLGKRESEKEPSPVMMAAATEGQSCQA